MSDEALQNEFDKWFKKLKPLPKDRYDRTVQVAKELADGVSRGYWRSNVKLSGSHNPVYQRKRTYWRERISTANTAGAESEAMIRAMEESLLCAGYVMESTPKLSVTPAAFALLRNPTRIERLDRWQTSIEIALVVIFFAHFLVLLPPAIESLQSLGIVPK